ncbi:MAG: G-D-S-L family lipolytic protein [Sphingobacteriales bacterium 17-39-43]|uniref:SGNH/GDSL hydrolase family protein n=1 Tax=Daejeonella sp. TaxID=2805397 RepID=UPI000BD29424|nr:SGNH/GDSL hydrolase family protein [Daejeonella sp.]OYY02941.1 MAG: G-D-S-L family lipolytic protein [Sphingobacteriia bacterium 35-40-5]OYZ33388.1 MAG: G-D-S-L family lipolytic protein [Sphingobacteriales bacterium 16-39-50]OZA24431.1 MAG: G-D-S-L family lipolytic protein [Sphingobacteriales bacterium 17-39-43]HQT22404.1 SGNH/GDSL hydrolase family protein [Daejeonella sp.]HQT56755.1 SGNH/GDSL hydrolase family protein [Daejeonella sp.]
MKKVLLSFAVILIMSSMQIQKPVKVIFFGDSITRAGVTPGGYITLMQEALRGKTNPEYELIGAGIGGNKVYDLFLRFEDDVLSKKPDVVVMYIGVNDVWHKQSSQTGTDPDKFIAFYTAMIKKMQAAGIRVIVCTPAAIGERTDFSNAQDGDLNRYSNIIRELARKYSCGLVDLRKAFLDYNLKNNPENKESGILTTDRVHLNPAGNKLVADLMIKALSEK